MSGAAPWLAACPERLRPTLIRCAEGAFAPNVALMRVVVEAADRDEAEQAVAAALAGARILPADQGGWLWALAELWAASPGAWEAIKAVLREVDHTPGGAPRDVIAGLAAGFDRAVEASPEASVAIYGLGSQEVLLAATAELMAVLRTWGLLGARRRVLDVGCGIGRVEKVLAVEVGEILGVDISERMIAAARAWCADLPNVRFAVGSGEDLSVIGDRRFDLVLAVDSFPYIVQAGGGVAARHIADAAAALDQGGDLVMFNWSYRGDSEADRREVAELAALNGLAVVRNGVHALHLWDGVGFHLRRARR